MEIRLANKRYIISFNAQYIGRYILRQAKYILQRKPKFKGRHPFESSIDAAGGDIPVSIPWGDMTKEEQIQSRILSLQQLAPTLTSLFPDGCFDANLAAVAQKIDEHLEALVDLVA